MSDPERFPREGITELLDPRIERRGDGEAVVTIPHRERITNPMGDVVNGGIVATSIDMATGMAIASTHDDPEGAFQTTTDLTTSYLRPAVGDLTATATVVRAGGSLAVARATVTSATPDGDRDEVAVGRTTYRVVDD